MRLNKFIADCGVCSRRAADKLIEEGRVKVNGKTVSEMGYTLKQNDNVSVDGNSIVPPARFTYIMLNKPKGCITTASDDKGRKTVFDYVGLENKRLFPVGRLDYDTEGLLILTDDGDLTYKLTHPSHHIGKTYVAHVEGEVKEGDIAVLRNGIVLDGVKTSKCRIKNLGFDGKISKIEITIFEGKNRQIRRMFESKGYNIVFLKRISIGDLKVGGLSRGKTRHLRDDEIDYLKSL